MLDEHGNISSSKVEQLFWEGGLKQWRRRIVLMVVVFVTVYAAVATQSWRADPPAITDEEFVGLTVYAFEIEPPVVKGHEVTVTRIHCNVTDQELAVTQTAILNPVGGDGIPYVLWNSIPGVIGPRGAGCSNTTCADDDPTRGTFRSETCPEVFPIGVLPDEVPPGLYTLVVSAIIQDPQSGRTQPKQADATTPIEVK